MPYPRMICVRQRLQGPTVPDVAAAVRAELGRVAFAGRVQSGETVAVTAGSRGIANLPLVLRTVIGAIRATGGLPVVVPAMGSHGGGTAEGQRRVLEGYGLGEAALGAPIRASMDTVHVGDTAGGVPIHVSRLACEADRVVVVNRVKPHTSFTATIESGLCKMATVGLGNHTGAATYHRAMAAEPFDRLVRAALPLVRARCPLALGLALVENAAEDTAVVEALLPDDFLTREPDLLAQARAWMPRLPLREIDLLVVDEMGKDVSGLGMDPNVTGRKTVPSADLPVVRRLFVRALTPASHGNAHGIGQADFTTVRLVRSLDRGAMMLNAVTAGNPEGARVPIAVATDREAVDAALASLGLGDAAEARIVRIRNTLRLDLMHLSEAALAALDPEAPVTASSSPCPLAFDGAGMLPPIEAWPA
jgi:hypothetical protein